VGEHTDKNQTIWFRGGSRKRNQRGGGSVYLIHGDGTKRGSACDFRGEKAGPQGGGKRERTHRYKGESGGKKIGLWGKTPEKNHSHINNTAQDRGSKEKSEGKFWENKAGKE